METAGFFALYLGQPRSYHILYIVTGAAGSRAGQFGGLTRPIKGLYDRTLMAAPR